MNEDYGQLVMILHAKRLAHLIEAHHQKVIVRGKVEIENRYRVPTIFKAVLLEDLLMVEEFFASLLQTMTYDSLEESDRYLVAHPKPVAFYIFLTNLKAAYQLIHRYVFRGGCISDVVTHVASHYLLFEGVETSGIGCYHAKASFDTTYC